MLKNIAKWFLSEEGRLKCEIKRQAKAIRNGGDFELSVGQILFNHNGTLTYKEVVKLLVQELRHGS